MHNTNYMNVDEVLDVQTNRVLTQCPGCIARDKLFEELMKSLSSFETGTQDLIKEYLKLKR